MNIAQLLAYGPKLEKTYSASKPKTEASRNRIGDRTIEKYRGLSVDNKVWSTLIASKLGMATSSASRNLLEICRRGYLKPVGKNKENKSSNKPVIYEWTHHEH